MVILMKRSSVVRKQANKLANRVRCSRPPLGWSTPVVCKSPKPALATILVSTSARHQSHCVTIPRPLLELLALLLCVVRPLRTCVLVRTCVTLSWGLGSCKLHHVPQKIAMGMINVFTGVADGLRENISRTSPTLEEKPFWIQKVIFFQGTGSC